MKKIASIAFLPLLLLVAGVQMAWASTPDLVMTSRPQSPTNLHDYSVVHQRKNAFPSSYDSREHGYAYPVRDQVIGGPCWAFAHSDAMRAGMNTLGCPETGAIATSVFTNCHTCNIPHLTGGGNQYMAVSMIANLKGPVLEKDYPFSTTDTLCPLWSPEDMYAMPLSAAFLPKDDIESVKGAILEFGIVSGALYWKGDFYQPEQNYYCYTGKEAANHEICLVGWDDAKKAWLVRNSWGPNAHEDGHVWVGYEDVHINKENTCYYQMVPKTAIDQVFTYATSPSLDYSSSYPNEPISGIVRFTTPTQQEITYIGTYTKYANTFIEYSIYQGKEKVYQSNKEMVRYPSFTTFALETPVSVQGEFYVRVTYSMENGTGEIPIESIEHTVYNPQLHTGDQWVEINGEYEEAGENSILQADLVIFAYTKDKTPTTIWETEEEGQIPVILNGKINPEIWKEAEWIHVFDLSGHEIGNLTAEEYQIPAYLSGVYLFQVLQKDGTSHTQKYSLP